MKYLNFKITCSTYDYLYYLYYAKKIVTIMCQSIIASWNSYLEHRASTTHHHITLFLAATFTLFQFKQLWFPLQFISSRCYVVFPYVLNLVDSIQEPAYLCVCGFCNVLEFGSFSSLGHVC
jgi:hypothetical protein